MSNIAKLKKKAAEFELKRQFDKALAIYIELLDDFDANAHELDVALFNRVGDMLLRQGNVADAVDYYERAVDRYADGGFFNNAIALCNKILRQSPGRASVYYKLGRISALKGFKADAKQNFLEYADRMQKAGRIDEAFRALKEFADLCPDQDDIRLMLADQLSRQSRGGEAIEQLQTLFDRYSTDGRDAEARATLDRIRSIDPSYEPRVTGRHRAQKESELVFLDLYATDDEPASGAQGANTDLPFVDVDEPRAGSASAPEAAPEPAPELPEPPAAAAPLTDLEPTGFDRPPDAGVDSLLDLEPTSFGTDASPPSPPDDDGALLDGLVSTGFDLPWTPAPASTDHRSPTPPPVEEIDVGGLQFMVPLADEPPADAPPAPATDDSGLQFIDPGADELAADAPPAPATDDSVAPDDVADEVPPLIDLELPFLQQDGSPAIGHAEFKTRPGEAVQPGTEASVPELQPGDLWTAGTDSDVLPPLDQARTEEAAPSEDTSNFPTVDSTLADGDAAAADERSAFDAAWAAGGESDAAPLSGSGLEIQAFPDDFPELGRDFVTDAAGSAADDAGDDASADGEAPFDDSGDARLGSATLAAERSVERLEAAVAAHPEDLDLRRQLGEARLESGDREGGLGDLDAVMVGRERVADLGGAASIADEIARLTPDSVRIHQKRVEYAFRLSDRPRLVSAYLDLAAALLGDGQTDKARTVYRRVLDLAPDDIAAQSGLAALQTRDVPAQPAALRVPTPLPGLPGVPPAAARDRTRAESPRPSSRPMPETSDAHVNLGDWLRADEAPKSTRMVVEEKEPSGDEEADFAEMLRKFKQGVAENVDEEDHQSHYDLGVAFKEMGLIDEAIAEFQKALRAPANRLPTYEALGQCFVDKGQYKVANALLARGLAEHDASDEQLVGVLYLLGTCAEGVGRPLDAVEYYQRVFVVDIQFRDVARRLEAIEQAR